MLRRRSVPRTTVLVISADNIHRQVEPVIRGKTSAILSASFHQALVIGQPLISLVCFLWGFTIVPKVRINSRYIIDSGMLQIIQPSDWILAAFQVRIGSFPRFGWRQAVRMKATYVA